MGGMRTAVLGQRAEATTGAMGARAMRGTMEGRRAAIVVGALRSPPSSPRYVRNQGDTDHALTAVQRSSASVRYRSAQHSSSRDADQRRERGHADEVRWLRPMRPALAADLFNPAGFALRPYPHGPRVPLLALLAPPVPVARRTRAPARAQTRGRRRAPGPQARPRGQYHHCTSSRRPAHTTAKLPRCILARRPSLPPFCACDE